MGRQRFGANAPVTKNAYKGRGDSREGRRWSPREKRVLWENYDLPSAELARLLPGRSPKAVRRARERFGRYNRALVGMEGVCVRCDDRPVWAESRHARRMHLCKDCYLSEMEERDREEARANAARQRKFKAKGRGEADA